MNKQQDEKSPTTESWRALPQLPSVEVSDLGRVRVIKDVTPGRDGLVRAQVGGRRLACSLEALHRAAWPERWPALAGPASVVVLAAPSRPFRGIDRAGVAECAEPVPHDPD